MYMMYRVFVARHAGVVRFANVWLVRNNPIGVHLVELKIGEGWVVCKQSIGHTTVRGHDTLSSLADKVDVSAICWRDLDIDELL
jgi:hypothetical protein